MFDLDLFDDLSTKTHMKRLAVEICVGLVARTIGQSEFRIREDRKTVKDEMYYRLNVRPNRNMSASFFWQTVVRKLIYENECLIIKSDTDDLLIADSFDKEEYAIYDDTFKSVVVRGYEFKRTFTMDEVIYFQYTNQKLSRLIDELYTDYGELFGRLVEFQKRKNQIRATVDIEGMNNKSKEEQGKLQRFIDRLYKSIKERAVAIVPQQKGYTYKEHQLNQASGPGVEEINRLTDGFLYQIALAVGIPIPILRGDVAEIEKQTKNYMIFCIDPLLQMIKQEFDAKLIEKDDYLIGKEIDVKRIRYRDIFDLANAVDKLRASGLFNGNELRDELGKEQIDDPILEQFFITKNYQESSEALKGGEKDEKDE
jgi:HK97 family phage portal protein|nr:phage portal protein [Alkalihalophilus marmarensis]